MLTEYDTKEQALEMSLYYAGFKDEELRKEKLAKLLNSNPEKCTMEGLQIDPNTSDGKKVDIYEFNNPKGRKVQIGIGNFRARFDLWFFNPKTGVGCRR